MPLYDSDNSCYRFYEYEVAYKTKGTFQVDFGIQLFFKKAEAYELIASGNSKTEIKLYFTWEGKSSPMVYTFSESQIKTFCNKAKNQLNDSGKVTTALVVRLDVSSLNNEARNSFVSTGTFNSTTLVASSVEIGLPQAE